MIVDAYLVYSFIRRLITPFDKWDAYKEGIIDAEGNILKQRKNLTKVSERQSFQLFDLLILNIKKSLSKIPGGNTRIATFSAALWLIREHDELLNRSEMLSEEDIESSLNEYMAVIEESSAPTTTVGGGSIAGAGVDPDGEPGFAKPLRMVKRKIRNQRG